MENHSPSFKVALIIIPLYILFLFVPTFDVAATYNLHLYFFTVPISVAGLIFPAIYPLSDSITEVYGKRTAYSVVVACYIIAVLFSLFNNLLLSQAHNHVLYSFILKSSLILTIAGPIGYFLTGIFNVKFLNRLKIKLCGKHFVLRSLVCSGISEVLISFIIYPAIFYSKGIHYALFIAAGTCVTKILLTIPMVFIAKFLVVFYRYSDGVEFKPYSESLAEFSQDATG